MPSGLLNLPERTFSASGRRLQRLVAWVLLAFAPAAMAQQTGVAVVYSTGSVYLNGGLLAISNAVVAGDVIQTKENGTATLTGPGYSVLMEPNSILRFQGDSVALDRGEISVATGKSLRVNARDFRITPVSSNWTQYYVTRSGGVIGVLARKNDVTVNCGPGSTTVKEGQQISRADAENCGLVEKKPGAPSAATAPILTSKTAQWVGVIVGGGLTAWALAHDDEVSPDRP